MKQLTATLIFIVSCCLTTSSLADNDFSKIRKDIKVMNKIITGALEADEECRKCRASVSGSYLAGQGAIFVISPIRSFFREVFVSDGDWSVEHLDLEMLEELPEMIGQIVSDVGIAIGEIDIDHDGHEVHQYITARIGKQSDLERQTRNEVRSLRREMRRLRDELREQEIELIQAENSARVDLENSIEKLEAEASRLEAKRDQLNSEIDKAREARQQKLRKAKSVAEETKQQHNMMLEHLVLATMCDYGAALKNLPANERVTLLFEREGRRWTANRTKLYVLDKEDLLACQSDDLDKNGLIEKAISYNF